MDKSEPIPHTSFTPTSAKVSLLCKTEGCRIGTVKLPPFAISHGEWVVLRWPVNFGGEPEQKFYSMLCGERNPELDVFSKTQVATSVYSGQFSPESSQSVGGVLAGLDTQDAEVLMLEIRRAGVPLSSPLNHLPMTIRLLAGMSRASFESELVVFNASGLDPLGVQKIYAFVHDKLKRGRGFLELEFPGQGYKHSRPINVVVLDVLLAV